jgi:hypothetical protein
MPNRKFQLIDFTDPARHGGHVGNYVDGENIAYMTFRQNPGRTSYFCYVGTDPYGSKALFMSSPLNTGTYYAACNLHSPILPDQFSVEVNVGYLGSPSGYVFCSFLGIVDWDFDAFTYYTLQSRNSAGPQPFQATMNYDASPFMVGGGIRNASGGISNYYSYLQPSNLTGVYKHLLYKRTSGMGYIVLKENGEYLNGIFTKASDMLDFNKKCRFSIGNGSTWHPGYAMIRSILISEFNKVDIMDEVAPVVTTDGTIEGGAPDAKTAIHDNTEITRIVLNPGQYIEIDLTNTTKDAPINEIQITADSTDTNYLSAKLATHAMGGVWSVSVSLGNTSVQRCVGEKKQTGFTNTIRHIFNPEIAYLCGLAETETEGCRRIRIENNSAVQLKVYEIDVLQSMKEIAFGDDEIVTDVIVDRDITGADVPIGATGNIQEVNVRNTSESDTATCYVKMIDDGFYDPAIAVVEYADDPAGPWYDKLNPPPAPDGIQVGPVVPEGNMPFYMRTKLPSSGQLFQRFTAQFTVKMTNV